MVYDFVIFFAYVRPLMRCLLPLAILFLEEEVVNDNEGDGKEGNQDNTAAAANDTNVATNNAVTDNDGGPNKEAHRQETGGEVQGSP